MKIRWIVIFLTLWATEGLTGTEVNANCLSDQPGVFAYYKLAITRSPEWCIVNNRSRDTQCRYEFALHGLWPQCERDFPKRCVVADYSLLDEIDEQGLLNFFPSRKVIRDQWDIHGACSGLSRSAYFGLSVRLYQSVHMPKIDPGQYTENQLYHMILRENPGLLTNEMIELVCDAQMEEPLAQPDTLDEVRICFDRQGSPMVCLDRIKSCPDAIRVRANE